MLEVKFKRKTYEEIKTLPIDNGSVIFDTTNKEILMDTDIREKYTNNNYKTLLNKPKINGHELIGDVTNAELGIPTVQDVLNALPKWNGGSY